MNIDLMTKLIIEQDYCIDKITVDYDIMPCEYKVEVILCAGNMERITFQKEYNDSEDSLLAFGSDLKAIGEIFQKISKSEDSYNDYN